MNLGGPEQVVSGWPMEGELQEGSPLGEPGLPGERGGRGRRAQRGGAGQSANKRHIATEQRRRDKINEGYAALQKLLPRIENVEKATLLMQAADYTRQLQARRCPLMVEDAMRQLLELEGAAKLPEEMQWAIRMLLPRPKGVLPFAAGPPAAAPVPAQSAAPSHLAPPSGPPAAPAAPPDALALLAQHVHQAAPPLAPGGTTPAPPAPSSAAPPVPDASQAAALATAAATGGAGAAAQMQQLLAQFQQQQQHQAASQQLQWSPAALLQALQLQQLLQQASGGGAATPALLQLPPQAPGGPPGAVAPGPLPGEGVAPSGAGVPPTEHAQYSEAGYAAPEAHAKPEPDPAQGEA